VGEPIRVPWDNINGCSGQKERGSRGTAYGVRVRKLCHRLPIMSPISGLVGEPIRVPWDIIKGCSGQKERGSRGTAYGARVRKL
jgi:hypothetical protein